MKEYKKPILSEEVVEVEDVIALSTDGTWGDALGDVEHSWPFK